LNPFLSGPNPRRVLERVLALKAPARRGLLRLEVWCEANACTPVRVFDVREGLLVQCRSDADVSSLAEANPHLGRWSPRGAFFIDEWTRQVEGDQTGSHHLQVVCDCVQTRPRLVDVQRVRDLVPPVGERTRAVSIAAVAIADG
jgi:hypothetical protein